MESDGRIIFFLINYIYALMVLTEYLVNYNCKMTECEYVVNCYHL